MRAKLLLLGGLSLLVGACTAKVNHAPPTFDHELLIGKWQNRADLFVTGYEFAKDGSLTMSVKGMDKPIPGHYSWNGERALELQYQLSPDMQKAYQAAVKAYKDGVTEGIQSKRIPDRAGPGMLSAARHELPAKETLRASISTAEKPHLLMLTDETSGNTMTLERVE
jgi:hypothetical protein